VITNNIARLGGVLFCYRRIIALLFFILLVFYARPTPPRLAPALLLSVGMALRIWAAGYIGPAARQSTFYATSVIISGPYRLLKHPLYIGNFFLVLGVILLFNPPIVLASMLVVLFIIEYTAIIVAERKYLKNMPHSNVPFRWRNARGELSTLFVLIFIVLVYGARLLLRSY
jgi:protein-S-isoprenylcysteine O-methyltransferase Ste14